MCRIAAAGSITTFSGEANLCPRCHKKVYFGKFFLSGRGVGVSASVRGGCWRAHVCSDSREGDIAGKRLASTVSALREVQQDSGCRQPRRGEIRPRPPQVLTLFNSATIYVIPMGSEFIGTALIVCNLAVASNRSLKLRANHCDRNLGGHFTRAAFWRTTLLVFLLSLTGWHGIFPKYINKIMLTLAILSIC